MKKILITGSNGFIGQNLKLWLDQKTDLQYVTFTRSDNIEVLYNILPEVDFIIHLAAVNRSSNERDFISSNIELTKSICDCIINVFLKSGKKIPILYTSSTQAGNRTIYGNSKFSSEEFIYALEKKYSIPVFIMRLPNVFGKWCKPNYNSVIATFCYNVINDIPIIINDPSAKLNLIYIDEVVNRFIDIIEGNLQGYTNENCHNNLQVYNVTVGEIADLITQFKVGRNNLSIEKVGEGFVRALYSTYISYLAPSQFSYKLKRHDDERGSFVEMLKTNNSGQFSYFIAYPGVTRGGHYHHTKTEKFLVIQGRARFRFSNIKTGERHEIDVDGKVPEVVDTSPGWAHDITNIGSEPLIVMLWANEIFNPQNPDTFFVKM